MSIIGQYVMQLQEQDDSYDWSGSDAWVYIVEEEYRQSNEYKEAKKLNKGLQQPITAVFNLERN